MATRRFLPGLLRLLLLFDVLPGVLVGIGEELLEDDIGGNFI